jgi:hypothetical protein
MAFTTAEIDEFIAALQQDPQLRDRVRNAILADDFLALPGIVRQLGEDLRALVAEVRSMRGDLGRITGRLYEFEYDHKLDARIGRHFKIRRDVSMPDYPPIDEAYTSGRLSDSEWDDLMRIDVAVIGRPRRKPDDPESVILIELSIVVDTSDVARAARRAAIIERLGIPVIPCVDGEVITPEAQALAKQERVMALVRKATYPGDY